MVSRVTVALIWLSGFGGMTNAPEAFFVQPKDWAYSSNAAPIGIVQSFNPATKESFRMQRKNTNQLTPSPCRFKKVDNLAELMLVNVALTARIATSRTLSSNPFTSTV